MASKKFSKVRNVLGNAAIGATTGLIAGATIDPSATSSWAKTGANVLLGSITGVVGGANGRSQHMAQGVHESRK
jgi:hypothetical protein